MQNSSWGERLRARARDLGLSDSEVARRVGLTQRRYSSYVNMSREPNFADLLRICDGLAITPDHVLGVGELQPSDDAARRIVTALQGMASEHRLLAVAAIEGMAAVGATSANGHSSAEEPVHHPSTTRRRATEV